MADVIHEKEIEAFLKAVRPQLKRFAGKKIAIKIHFGEPGNTKALTPEQVKPLTDILKELNIGFFFYDSSVAYPSPRNMPETHKQIALEKGWGALGEIRTDDDFVAIKGKHMSYEVCRQFIEADGVLVISHVKGHVCSGFGGAIKNLGMGALSKVSKAAIHNGGKPVFVGECTACGTCAANCPIHGIEVTDKAEFVTCYGCSNCITVCPEHALAPKVALFDELLAGGAHAAATQFKDAFYISIMNNITKECDCESDPKKIIAQDCGYLASTDIVAIDKAAHDIITAAAGEDVFLKHNLKSGLDQINAAEQLNMGSSK